MNYYIKAAFPSSQQDEITVRVEADQCFRYGNASYKSFSENYKSDGWFGRKVSAIPYIAVGVIKLIYHFTTFLLSSLPNLCCQKSKYIKNDLYRISRDGEEILGHFLTLFNDKLGCYLVQESECQKNWYEIHKNAKPQSIEVNSQGINSLELAHQVSLYDLKNMTDKERLTFLVKFNLKEDLEKFISLDTFWDVTYSCDHKFLSNIKMKDILENKDPLKLKYLLTPLPTLKKTPMSQLLVDCSKSGSPEFIDIVHSRLKLSYLVPLGDKKIKDISTGDFFQTEFSHKQINELIEIHRKNPEGSGDLILSFLSVSQIKNWIKTLDISLLDRASFDYLSKNDDFLSMLSDKEVVELGKKFNFSILEKMKYDRKVSFFSVFNEIDSAIFKNILISQLSNEDYKIILTYSDSVKKTRFSLFENSQAVEIIKKFGSDEIANLSENQLTFLLDELDVDSVDDKAFQLLFLKDYSQGRGNFAQLSNIKAEQMFKKFGVMALKVFSSNQLDYLIPELNMKELNKLNLDSFNFLFDDNEPSKNRKNFARLSNLQAKEIIYEIDSKLIRLISDSQREYLIKNVDIQNMNPTIYKELFNWVTNPYTQLTPDQRTALLDKYPSFINLYPDKDLMRLDLSKLTKEHINELFTTLDVEHWTVYYTKRPLLSYPIEVCVVKTIEEIRARNIKKLTLLKEQISQFREKLTLENQALADTIFNASFG